MNKNSLLLLAVSALLVANTARSETAADSVSLPTYVVSAKRVAPAEEKIQHSLGALRDLARAPIAVSVELPDLKARVALDAKVPAGTRLAKF